jgi:hypothetical protein
MASLFDVQVQQYNPKVKCNFLHVVDVSLHCNLFETVIFLTLHPHVD